MSIANKKESDIYRFPFCSLMIAFATLIVLVISAR